VRGVPDADTGRAQILAEAFHSILDPFAVMAVAAAATRTAVIGTNVLNAPWYPPALLARSLTTIDLISGGRLVAGFGTGWSPDEYRASVSRGTSVGTGWRNVWTR
jgi:alkanesulfonate monooxygenase SsuD/methylene tetrahydromethanopterin reductase-like flavin-dependent oxidoreductase (luciferase family)